MFHEKQLPVGSDSFVRASDRKAGWRKWACAPAHVASVHPGLSAFVYLRTDDVNDPVLLSCFLEAFAFRLLCTNLGAGRLFVVVLIPLDLFSDHRYEVCARAQLACPRLSRPGPVQPLVAEQRKDDEVDETVVHPLGLPFHSFPGKVQP